MPDDSLIKLLNEFPILADILKVLGGAAIPSLWSAYRFGRYRERAIISAEDIAKANHAVCVANDAYEKERVRADTLETKINVMKEVVHYHGHAFVKRDPAPHHPLCPSCLAAGIRTRMLFGIGLDGLMVLTCPIKTCDIVLKFTKDVVDDLLNCDLAALPNI